MTTKAELASVPINLIDPGTRARKEYKDIAALAGDIKIRGLIHPIAVMASEKHNGYLLLAGGRRMAASKFAGIKDIECKIFPDGLSDIEIKSIELMENILREDLSFDEEAYLEREILALQQEIYGIKESTSPDAEGVSKTDVAEMMGISREKLRQDTELADTMDQFPELDWKNLKNRSEALKLKENITKLVIRQQAVEQFNKETNAGQQDRYMERLANSYIVGDFFEKVKEIPDGSMNLVEIDPPYAIRLERLKKKEGSVGNYHYGESGYNEIDSVEYDTFMLNTFKECYRIMAPDSFLLCWFGPEPWFPFILDWLRAVKFNVRGMPCIWTKQSGQTLTPTRHLANAYEMFFYAKKGDPKINRPGMTNIFDHSPVSPVNKIHPTERPMELMVDILTTFTPEGSRILVPFAGSGNTILAAYQSKMTAIGFDIGQLNKDAYITRLMGGTINENT